MRYHSRVLIDRRFLATGRCCEMPASDYGRVSGDRAGCDDGGRARSDAAAFVVLPLRSTFDAGQNKLSNPQPDVASSLPDNFHIIIDSTSKLLYF
jgi:hypothetical protein